MDSDRSVWFDTSESFVRGEFQFAVGKRANSPVEKAIGIARVRNASATESVGGPAGAAIAAAVGESLAVYDVHVLTRLVAVASGVLLACGGMSSRDEPAATRARGSISSREAFDAFRAELPGGARVLELRGSPDGTLAADGRDLRWLATSIVDADGRSGWSAWVEPNGAGIEVELGSVEVPECSSAGLVDVDSIAVVPATLAKLDELNLRTPDRVTIEYWQQAPCKVIATSMAFTRTGHMVQISRRGTDWSEFYFAHYDDAGTLHELCGPCESSLVTNCFDCAR